MHGDDNRCLTPEPESSASTTQDINSQSDQWDLDTHPGSGMISGHFQIATYYKIADEKLPFIIVISTSTHPDTSAKYTDLEQALSINQQHEMNVCIPSEAVESLDSFEIIRE